MTVINKLSFVFLRDVISLYGVAAVNLLLPIFFIPYATTKIGVYEFGSFAVLAALFQYGNMVVEFGSTSPLVRSLSSGNSVAIFWGAVVFRLYLSLASAVTIFFILRYIYNEVDGLSILISFSSLVGAALNPVSLFQSKNKLPMYSLIMFVSRFFTSIGAVFFLQYYEEIWVVCFFQFFPIFLASILSLIFLFNKENLNLCQKDAFLGNKKVFGDSVSFFIGTVFSSGYTVAIPIIVNHFFGGGAAGVYGIIERVVQPIKQTIMPLINILYPRICFLFSNNRKEAVFLSIKSTSLISSLVVFFSFVVFFLMEYFSKYVFKNIVPEVYLYPMVFNVLFVFISQLLVFFFIVPFGKGKSLKIIYMVMFIFFIAMTSFSVWMHSLIFIYWTLAAIELSGVVILLSVSCFTVRKILIESENIEDV